MASYPLSLRWERVGVRVILSIPKEGPLTLSSVEGSSGGRPRTANPSHLPRDHPTPDPDGNPGEGYSVRPERSRRVSGTEWVGRPPSL